VAGLDREKSNRDPKLLIDVDKKALIVFEQALIDGAREMGLRIDIAARKRLLIHFRTLWHWSSKMNLTTVKEPRQMAARLYLDSLVPADRLTDGTSLHDVGCGAGFPGLILKACRPGLLVTLTEARRKKTTFLKQAARQMKLSDGLDIRWRRMGWEAEELAENYEEVMSRAAFPPAEWLEQGSKQVAGAGRLWLFAGQPHGDGDLGETGSRRWIDEHMPPGFEKEEEIAYKLPYTNQERVLMTFRKQ
jgi:16S rRNA (guanine527-N7)-methyltransferase